MKLVSRNIFFIFLFFSLTQLVQPMETDTPKKIEYNFAGLSTELQHLVLCTVLDSELWDFQQKIKDLIKIFEMLGSSNTLKIQLNNKNGSFLLRFFLYLYVKNNDGEYLFSKAEVKSYLSQFARNAACCFHRLLEVPECFCIRRFYNARPAEKELKILMNDLLDYRFTIWGLVATRRIPVECLATENLSEIILCRYNINNLEGLENYDLIRLQRLHLHDNQLENLSECIGNFTNLRVLTLCFNRLKVLPPCIGKLTRLKELDISFNQLTRLPESIGKLTRLTTLALTKNKLESLSVNMGSFTNLKRLYLKKNQLTILPESMSNLAKLVIISLEENKFSQKEKEKIATRIKNVNVDCLAFY